MLKDRFWGVLFLSQMWESCFLFVSEMPNHFISPVPKSNSALCFEAAIFSFTEWPKDSYTEQNVLSVFNFDSNERLLVCTPNKKLYSAWLQQQPVPWVFCLTPKVPPSPIAKIKAKPETRLWWKLGLLASTSSHVCNEQHQLSSQARWVTGSITDLSDDWNFTAPLYVFPSPGIIPSISSPSTCCTSGASHQPNAGGPAPLGKGDTALTLEWVNWTNPHIGSLQDTGI